MNIEFDQDNCLNKTNFYFRYLIPCRHLMCSQRRHITDVEIYGKNAEKFLTLRPSFTNKINNNDR